MNTLLTAFQIEDVLTIKSTLKELGFKHKSIVTPQALVDKGVMEEMIPYCNTTISIPNSINTVESALQSKVEYRLHNGYEYANNTIKKVFPLAIYEIIEQLVEEYLKEDNRKWVIASSGGKDSSLLILTMWLALESIPTEKRKREVIVITSDTGLEHPEMVEYVNKNVAMINYNAKLKDLPISSELVLPRFEERFGPKVIGKGVKPSVAGESRRSCTSWWKINPASAYLKSQVQTGDVVIFTGVRNDESENRSRSISKNGDSSFIFPKKQDGKIISGQFNCHPIKNITTRELWNTLSEYEDEAFPWGITFAELYELYEGTGECPMQLDQQNKKSCGTSRNGCVICMMPTDDSMLRFHDEVKKVSWAAPMIELRTKFKAMLFHCNWRRNPSKHKLLYYTDAFNPFYEKKWDVIAAKNIKGAGSTNKKREFESMREINGIHFDNDNTSLCHNASPVYPDLQLGSFSLEARIFLLKNVLWYQRLAGLELVKKEEIPYIKQCWVEEFGWEENEKDLKPEPLEFEGALELDAQYRIKHTKETTVPNLVLPDVAEYRMKKKQILNVNEELPKNYVFYVHRDLGLTEEEIISNLTVAESKTKLSVPYFFNNAWRTDDNAKTWWNVICFVVHQKNVTTQKEADSWVDWYMSEGFEDPVEPNWSNFLKKEPTKYEQLTIF